MAVDLDNVTPTSDRINAATSSKQLAGIRNEVQSAEFDCIAEKGWEGGTWCNLVANALYFHIKEKDKTLPKDLAGSPMVITVGGESTPAAAPTAAVYQGSKAQAFAASPATWLGLALLAGGAYYLWRYTRK
jgi:hypothetical protein